jgi:hypothetical protein
VSRMLRERTRKTAPRYMYIHVQFLVHVRLGTPREDRVCQSLFQYTLHLLTTSNEYEYDYSTSTGTYLLSGLVISQ